LTLTTDTAFSVEGKKTQQLLLTNRTTHLCNKFCSRDVNAGRVPMLSCLSTFGKRLQSVNHYTVRSVSMLSANEQCCWKL